jgi:hypothetical protein
MVGGDAVLVRRGAWYRLDAVRGWKVGETYAIDRLKDEALVGKSQEHFVPANGVAAFGEH